MRNVSLNSKKKRKHNARQDLSEADRLKELAEAKDAEAQELAGKLAKLEQQIEVERKQSAFKQVASSGEFNLSADRVEAALKLADLSAVEKAEDGGYDVKGVIQSLVETYPFLIEKAEPQPVGKPTPGSIDLPKSTEEQLEVLRKKHASPVIARDMANYAKAKRELGNKLNPMEVIPHGSNPIKAHYW